MAYEIDKINYLQIGIQGENIARKIEIDMTKWVQELEADHVSGYSFNVIFKPYNDPNKYPMVTTYNSTTKILTWKIGSAATQTPGVGYTEVRAQEATSGLVKKTRIIPTSVEESVSGNETDPPEVQEGWVTNVLNAGASAVNANTAAQAAKTAAETARDAAQAAAGNFQDLSASVTGLAAGASPTVNVTHSEGGYYNLAFGIPKGDKGDQGDPAPEDLVTPAVNAYLEENFSNPSNPPLDRSLASSSSAAPADMVGDLKSTIERGIKCFDDEFFDKTTFTNPSSTASNNRYWGFTVNETVKQLTFTPAFQSSGEFEYDLCVTNNGQPVADSSAFTILYSGKAATGTTLTLFNITPAHFVRIKSSAVPYYTTKANAGYPNARLIYCGVGGDAINQSGYASLCFSGTFSVYAVKVDQREIQFFDNKLITESSYTNPSSTESNNRYWGFTVDKPVNKLTVKPAFKTAGAYSYALCKMTNNQPVADNGSFDILEEGTVSTATAVTFYNLTTAHFVRIKSEGIPYYTTKANAVYENARLIYLGVNGDTIRQSGYTNLRLSGIFTVHTANLHPNWKGLKWVCVGDSLTEVNNRTTKHYFDYIAEATGIAPYNMGVGGTGYLKNEGETDNNFYTRVDNIPADADLITIFGSGNDTSLMLHNVTPLGNATDTTLDTICGAINLTISKIQASHPLVPLGIIAPTPWSRYNPFTNPTNEMAQYCEKLKEICSLRGVPYLDLYRCSNLRPWSNAFQALAYSKDNGNGVHPDENGHRIIAPRFMSFIETLIDQFVN